MNASRENPPTASHREAIRALYDAYFETLDDGRLSALVA